MVCSVGWDLRTRQCTFYFFNSFIWVFGYMCIITFSSNIVHCDPLLWGFPLCFLNKYSWKPSFFFQHFLKDLLKTRRHWAPLNRNRFMFAKMYYLFTDSFNEIYSEWMCNVRTRYIVVYIYGYGCFAVGCRLVPSTIGCQCWILSVAYQMGWMDTDWVE